MPKKGRGSPGNSPPGSRASSPPGTPRSSASSSSNARSAGSGPINKLCHFHRPWRTEANGGPKTCTSGSACRYIHASSEQQYADKLKAQRKGKGSRGSVGTTYSGFLLAAALGAAFPDIAGSTAVAAPSMPYASLDSFAPRGFPGPQWVDEVFTDIHAPNSFLDWGSQLNVAARPSAFLRHSTCLQPMRCKFTIMLPRC